MAYCRFTLIPMGFREIWLCKPIKQRRNRGYRNDAEGTCAFLSRTRRCARKLKCLGRSAAAGRVNLQRSTIALKQIFIESLRQSRRHCLGGIRFQALPTPSSASTLMRTGGPQISQRRSRVTVRTVGPSPVSLPSLRPSGAAPCLSAAAAGPNLHIRQPIRVQVPLEIGNVLRKGSTAITHLARLAVINV
jgi:hypothetical protein